MHRFATVEREGDPAEGAVLVQYGGGCDVGEGEAHEAAIVESDGAVLVFGQEFGRGAVSHWDHTAEKALAGIILAGPQSEAGKDVALHEGEGVGKVEFHSLRIHFQSL